MSTENKVHLELLIGTLVVDVDGKRVGRIEEVHAHRKGAECYIDEYVVGRAGLAERLGARWKPARKPSVIPWQTLDLSDPAHPRLRCRLGELES